jgi:hypothetical protein
MVSFSSQSCNVAFKEWWGVCDALIQGRQTVILRKGGIDERAGPGRFVLEHSRFWLYPTGFHQAQQGLRDPSGQELQRPAATADPARQGSILISGLVDVGFVGRVTSAETLPFLETFHCLAAETVLKRFYYHHPGLWVLAARVWRKDPGSFVTPTAEQAGCKTWVILDEPLPTAELLPVLDQEEWDARCSQLSSILGLTRPIEDQA